MVGGKPVLPDNKARLTSFLAPRHSSGQYRNSQQILCKVYLCKDLHSNLPDGAYRSGTAIALCDVAFTECCNAPLGVLRCLGEHADSRQSTPISTAIQLNSADGVPQYPSGSVERFSVERRGCK
jgi:hypothetical protein